MRREARADDGRLALPAPAEAQLADIAAARERIQPHLAATPLHEATSLTEVAGTPVFAKLESMNPTGAFKVRGALNSLLCLEPGARSRGVVTASGGSHGLGVSFAAARLGVAADVFLGSEASPAKVAKIRRLGADVHMAGTTYHDAHDAAMDHAASTGRTYVHAYADPAVVAGQGTIGLEILDQLPDVRTVVVPVGGGGLISGITVAIRSQRPDVRILAVQPGACPALSRSLAEGVYHETFGSGPTIADGLAGGIGRSAVDLVRAGWIDGVVDVPEPEIHRALAWIYREEQWMIEGAAALAVAAVLTGRVHAGGPICVVLTGSNIELDRLVGVLTENA